MCEIRVFLFHFLKLSHINSHQAVVIMKGMEGKLLLKHSDAKFPQAEVGDNVPIRIPEVTVIHEAPLQLL